MRRSWKWLAAAWLALAGCEGTEVGNPEVTMAVTAQIAVIESGEKVNVADLNFRMLGMSYGVSGYAKPDSGVCWKRPAGILIDLADPDAKPLADTLVEDEPWTWARMVFRAPDGPASLPDSADFRTWSNPRYAKFTLGKGKDTLQALFEMPAGMEIRLAYSAESVATWNWGDSIWVPIIFDADIWAGTLDPAGPWKRRRDGRQAAYALFSPTENDTAWAGLKARLSSAFIADTVQVRQVP